MCDTEHGDPRSVRDGAAGAPGVGTLVEVHEREAEYAAPPLVERVEVVGRDLEQAARVLEDLGGETVVAATASDPTLTVDGTVVPFRRLART